MSTIRPGIPVRTAAVITLAGTNDWLLVRSPQAHHGWILPGGHVIPGEAPSQTIVRELREELSLDLNHPFLKIVTWTAPSDPEQPGSFTYVFDLGEIETDLQIVPKEDEIGAWQWMERSLVAEMVNPAEADRIQQLLSGWHADGPLYVEQWPGGLPL